MKSTVRKATKIIATFYSSTPTWVIASLTGALLGELAQLLRQIPGALMSLGASTAPWVMVGFILAASASRGARTLRKAIFVSIGTVAAYLLAWLVLYHLLFMLQASLPFSDGWREAVPWLVIAVPACPILGAVAALSHKPGHIGDTCLAAPIAWLLPEVLRSLGQGWSGVVAIVLPVAVLFALMIRMTIVERRVRVITLLTAAVALGASGVFLYPVVRNQILS